MSKKIPWGVSAVVDDKSFSRIELDDTWDGSRFRFAERIIASPIKPESDYEPCASFGIQNSWFEIRVDGKRSSYRIAGAHMNPEHLLTVPIEILPGQSVSINTNYIVPEAIYGKYVISVLGYSLETEDECHE